MNKHWRIWIAAAGLTALPALAAAKSPASVKIGVVDMERILQTSHAGQQARQDLDDEKESKRKVLDQRKKEIDQLRQELAKKGAQLSPAARKEKEDLVQQKGQDLMRTAQQYESDLQQRDNELTGRILRDVGDVIRKYARDNDYTIVLEKRAVLYATDGTDITDAILSAYEKQRE